MNTLQQGTVLHGKSREYKIEKVLGQGSFGITYLATTKVQVQESLGSLQAEMKVAVKEFFMKDLNGREGTRVTSISSGGKEGLCEKYKSKFIKESQNLSKLQHPGIVKVLERFETNGTAYYVMEYCEGGSLDERIKSHGGLGEGEAKSLACKIGDALSYMHSRGMLHLDLKPGNIMLRADGTPVVIDFGLSKQYTADGKAESSTTVGLGTPGYAPLEQGDYQESKGKFPVTMDVYAFGATVFKMLTGNTPPKASEVMNHGFPAYELQDKNVSITTIRAIKKAMADRVVDRCQSVKEFVTLLGEESTMPDYEGEVDDTDDTIIREENRQESNSAILDWFETKINCILDWDWETILKKIILTILVIVIAVLVFMCFEIEGNYKRFILSVVLSILLWIWLWEYY